MPYKVSVVFRREEEEKVEVLNIEKDFLSEVLDYINEVIRLERIRNIDAIIVQRVK